MGCFRDQLLRNRIDRVLRSLKSYPNFEAAFHGFVQDEARREADNIVGEKDSARQEFNLETLRKFSYKAQLQKFQQTSPLLVACMVGTISKTKVTNIEEISRKGFGGRNRAEDIDLVPSIVQSVSRILKNRHPMSVSNVPCINSLYLWANRSPGHIFHFYNSLGDSYRYCFKEYKHP